MNKKRILIVDDEKDILTGLQRLLGKSFKNTEIRIAQGAAEAINEINKGSFNIALVDIQMPEVDGLKLLEKLQNHDAQLTIIMMTAFGSVPIAVEAMKRGAYDFISKPFEKDLLVRVLNKGIERNQLLREVLNLREKVGDQRGLSRFVGQSAPMLRLYDSIKTIAKTGYTVLIRGESGTGKELAALSIHELSERSSQPIVMVNCPAIPEHLLESELFGHKKGAFTSAESDHPGLFTEADQSSICLDEIADIPIQIQTKLLRVLQEKEIKQLGAASSHTIDVRVIALTNQNLEEKIQNNLFREDLFYRLNVVTLTLPSLRDIRDDIPLLATHFCKESCSELGIERKFFHHDALQELIQRPWPGNIRELQNVVRRAVMFCPENTIGAKHLHTPGDPDYSNLDEISVTQQSETGFENYKVARSRLVRTFEENYLKDLLRKTEGNVTKAAELSGLTRAALQKIMRRVNIKSNSFRLADQ